MTCVELPADGAGRSRPELGEELVQCGAGRDKPDLGEEAVVGGARQHWPARGGGTGRPCWGAARRRQWVLCEAGVGRGGRSQARGGRSWTEHARAMSGEELDGGRQRSAARGGARSEPEKETGAGMRVLFGGAGRPMLKWGPCVGIFRMSSARLS